VSAAPPPPPSLASAIVNVSSTTYPKPPLRIVTVAAPEPLITIENVAPVPFASVV